MAIAEEDETFPRWNAPFRVRWVERRTARLQLACLEQLLEDDAGCGVANSALTSNLFFASVDTVHVRTHTRETTMTAMFVNLPVTDLERAKAFYTALGFTIKRNDGKSSD